MKAMTLNDLRLTMLLDGWAEEPTANVVRWTKNKQVAWISQKGFAGGYIDRKTKNCPRDTAYQEIYDSITKLMEEYLESKRIKIGDAP